jgi:hypothetical protein
VPSPLLLACSIHTYTHIQIHCSGDGEGKHLFEIAKTIDAKMLYPIHTEHPEIYVRLTRKER